MSFNPPTPPLLDYMMVSMSTCIGSMYRERERERERERVGTFGKDQEANPSHPNL